MAGFPLSSARYIEKGDASKWPLALIKQINKITGTLQLQNFRGGSTVREAHAKNCNLTTAKFSDRKYGKGSPREEL